jgi:predicted TPR repeat methyltransferase
MDHDAYEIAFPQNAQDLDQNEEFIILLAEQRYEKVMLHDYQRFFEIPGLYEEVYKRLQCCSPQMLCGLLNKAMDTRENDTDSLRVLDFGAGNGMAGERLKENVGCETIVGVDIISEAKEAALRDRSELYDDYLVADFTDLDKKEKGILESYDFNTLFSVAALGYDDIGTEAFINAFDIVSDDAWIAFNIKDRFLSEDDSSGFRDTIQDLVQERLHIIESKRYVHRLSICEEPLYYVGVVGKKSEQPL